MRERERCVPLPSYTYLVCRVITSDLCTVTAGRERHCSAVSDIIEQVELGERKEEQARPEGHRD